MGGRVFECPPPIGTRSNIHTVTTVIKHVPMEVSTQCVTTPPPVAVQVTATLALPGGPRQLFPAPRAVAPGEAA